MVEALVKARINIKLSVGDYFIDDEGRILIYSSTDAIEIPEQKLPKPQELLIMVIMHVLMTQDGRDSLTLQEMELKIID